MGAINRENDPGLPRLIVNHTHLQRKTVEWVPIQLRTVYLCIYISNKEDFRHSASYAERVKREVTTLQTDSQIFDASLLEDIARAMVLHRNEHVQQSIMAIRELYQLLEGEMVDVDVESFPIWERELRSSSVIIIFKNFRSIPSIGHAQPFGFTPHLSRPPSNPVSIKGMLSNGLPTLLLKYEARVPTDISLRLFVQSLSKRHPGIPPLDMKNIMGWWMLALGSSRRVHRWDLGLSPACFEEDDGDIPLKKWTGHDLSLGRFELLVYVSPPDRTGWMNSEEYHSTVRQTKVNLEGLPTATLSDVEDMAMVLLFAADTSGSEPPFRTRHANPDVSVVFKSSFDPYRASSEDMHRIARVLHRAAYQAIMDKRMGVQGTISPSSKD
jgi:hypothetical protein